MATEYADYIFYGGTIITMEEENPSAEALAVKGTVSRYCACTKL